MTNSEKVRSLLGKVYATGFKGFNPDMTCRGKQYKENTVFEEPGTPGLCEYGMHFCKNPLDVLDYYDLVDKDGNPNAFAEVERCTGLKDQAGKLVYQNDRIHIEDPIPGIQEDVDLVVTWDKDGWVGQGKHGKSSLWTALTHHKVRVVGTIHDKEV